MKLIELLKGIRAEEQPKIILEYLNEGGEKRWRLYQELHEYFCEALLRKRNVTQAVNYLINKRAIQYYEEFQAKFPLSCIAAGKKIMTPKQIIQNSGNKLKRRCLV